MKEYEMESLVVYIDEKLDELKLKEIEDKKRKAMNKIDQGKFKEGIKLYSELLEKDPKCVEFLYLR